MIVDTRAQEVHPAPAVSFIRQPANRIPADADGLLAREAAAFGRSLGNTLGNALRRAIVAATPDEVEGIAFGSALAIFNADHGYPAVARIADQILPAATINALKAEFGRVTG